MDNFAARMGIPEWEFRLIFGRTRIEYDPAKDEINRRQHGISLESAVALFERRMMSALLGPQTPFAQSDGFRENGEVRHMHLDVDDDARVVLIVTTMRDDEVVRPISMRRASESERTFFLQQTGYVEPSRQA